jgi:hypothetical protein
MDARVKPEHDDWGAMLGLDPSMAARAPRTEITAGAAHR